VEGGQGWTGITKAEGAHEGKEFNALRTDSVLKNIQKRIQINMKYLINTSKLTVLSRLI